MPHLLIPILPNGALLDASIGLSVYHESDLKQRGEVVPVRVSVQALIDTGASQTCIDPSIAQKLNLSPIGRGAMHTASSGGNAHACNIYDISLIVPHAAQSLIISAMQVSDVQLAGVGHPFLAIIGRDILEKCSLFYQGHSNQLHIMF